MFVAIRCSTRINSRFRIAHFAGLREHTSCGWLATSKADPPPPPDVRIYSQLAPGVCQGKIIDVVSKEPIFVSFDPSPR